MIELTQIKECIPMKKSMKLLLATCCFTILLISVGSSTASAYPGPCHSPKPCVIRP